MQKRQRIEKPVVKSDGSHVFDYKDVEGMTHFLTERGRIIPRSRTGLTAKEQRALAQSVKRARVIALLPFAN